MSVTVPSVAPIPATGYTFQTDFGELLFEYLGPWGTLHLAWFCDAIGAMCSEWWDMVQDQGTDDGVTPTVGTKDANGNLITTGYQPGYGAALNPNIVPLIAAGYLAQFVGVQLPSGVDDATAQSLIREEAGINRGTDSAVIAAAKRTLTGTQSVELVRRTYVDGTPNGFWFGLIVRPEEVTTVAALEDAVNAVKMGGMMWWLTQTDGTTWNAEMHTWSGDTLTWNQKG